MLYLKAFHLLAIISWMAGIFYLPRICNHCTYPACLSSCPRASIYKRPEDGIVVIEFTVAPAPAFVLGSASIAPSA